MKNIWSLLESNKVFGWIITLIRFYYGYSWIHAGFGKLSTWGTDKPFTTEGFFNYLVLGEGGVVDKAVQSGDWLAVVWHWMVQNIMLPIHPFLDIVVPITELGVGVLLIVGFYGRVAAVVGALMNTMFLLSGIVYPNAHFIAAQALIASSKNPHQLTVFTLIKRFKK